jgi:hypothetical protein
MSTLSDSEWSCWENILYRHCDEEPLSGNKNTSYRGSRYEEDQTGGDQTGGDQTGGDQTGRDQTRRDQTRRDQTESIRALIERMNSDYRGTDDLAPLDLGLGEEFEEALLPPLSSPLVGADPNAWTSVSELDDAFIGATSLSVPDEDNLVLPEGDSELDRMENILMAPSPNPLPVPGVAPDNMAWLPSIYQVVTPQNIVVGAPSAPVPPPPPRPSGEETLDVVTMGDSSDEEEEDEEEEEENDDAGELGLSPLVSTNVPKPTPPEGMALPSGWDDLSAYEQQRQINVFRNQGMLHQLGLGDGDALDLKKKKKSQPRRQKTAEELIPTRGSTREKVQRQPYNEEQAVRSQDADSVVENMTGRGRGRGSGRGRGGGASGAGRGRARGNPTGDTWVNPSAIAGQPQQLVEEEQDTMASLYPQLWFQFNGAPTAGNIGITVDQLPPQLIDLLAEHIADLDKGEIETFWGTNQKLYWSVTVQSGKSKKPTFKGWQVQSWNPTVGATVRLGLTDESLLGAIMVALADIDDRLFSQEKMYSFLYYLIAHGKTALDRWLVEVGERISVVNPHGRRRQGGRGTSNTASRRRAREEQVADSFLTDETDTSAAETHGQSRKRAKMAQASSAVVAASAAGFMADIPLPDVPSLPPAAGAPVLGYGEAGPSNAALPVPSSFGEPAPDGNLPLPVPQIPDAQAPVAPPSPISYEEALELLAGIEDPDDSQ